MTAQAGAVAAHNPYQRAYVAAYATMAPAAQLKPLLAAIDDLREQARAFSEAAAVQVEALEGLVAKIVMRLHCTRDADLIHELTQLIKERSNG